MNEEEIFQEMELRQARESMVKMADKKADEFVIRGRDRLETLSLHEAYRLGYEHALLDAFKNGKVLF
jgi:hypothetical protein